MDILIVDNDRDSTDLYALVLKSYGAEVTTANSVKEALEILSSFMFDLLICEIRFLGESVYPLLQKVKFMTQISSKTTPILVISTCHPLKLAENLTVKVEGYLLKPISIDQLVTVVWDTVIWAKNVLRSAEIPSVPMMWNCTEPTNLSRCPSLGFDWVLL
jgi:CheY-like chemotaxis protein